MKASRRIHPIAVAIACCTMAFLTISDSVAEAISSPRLSALREILSAQQQSDRQQTLDAFWRQIKASGAPLVEGIAGDQASMLVTVLWREPAQNGFSNVVVWNEMYPDQHHQDALERLDGTDVWFRSYKVDSAARFSYRLGLPAGAAPQELRAVPRPSRSGSVTYEYFADPLARARAEPRTSRELNSSEFQGPRAVPEPWLDERIGTPKGRVDEFQATSTYLNNTRSIAIYTPPGYKAGGRYPFVVSFDKDEDEQRLPILLDNMIADGVVPPMIVAMVSNIDDTHRGAELPYNPLFGRFIAEELVPMIRQRYAITRDPSQAVVRGCSYGGIGSASVALAHSDVFGNVLSQSGSYWWSPAVALNRGDRELQMRELGWLPRKFATAKKLPLKFYLNVGSEEGSSITVANWYFRDILMARGYDVTYRQHVGGHCGVNARSIFPIGLITLLGTKTGRALLPGLSGQ